MRLLVIGGGGLVGGHILRFAMDGGIAAVGTSRAPSGPLRALDAADEPALADLVDKVSPTAIVHAAGYTWADGCERDPDRSWAENVAQPQAVAQLCARHGIAFVHCSSAYVFSGDAGPYEEDATPAPVNVYGRHKHEAEKRVLAATGGSALVLRLVHVWGVEAKMKNFAYQVRRANLSGEEVVASSTHSGNPTWAGDIAAWTLALLGSQCSGIWHLAGDHPETTRLQWAGSILDGLADLGQPRRAKLVPSVATSGVVAPRPRHAGLATAKIQAAFPRRCRLPRELPAEFA